MPIIISAFPGTGKTYAVQHWNTKKYGRVSDSDSSKFSWIYDENGNKTDQRNPDFPNNYINHIRQLISDGVRAIFVSSHEDVKNALNENGLKFISIYPTKDIKENYLERLRKRTTGLNDKKFISLIDKNWDNWIPTLNDEKYDKKIYKNCKGVIYLDENMYLLDIMILRNT